MHHGTLELPSKGNAHTTTPERDVAPLLPFSCERGADHATQLFRVGDRTFYDYTED